MFQFFCTFSQTGTEFRAQLEKLVFVPLFQKTGLAQVYEVLMWMVNSPLWKLKTTFNFTYTISCTMYVVIGDPNAPSPKYDITNEFLFLRVKLTKIRRVRCPWVFFQEPEIDLQNIVSHPAVFRLAKLAASMVPSYIADLSRYRFYSF